MALEETLTFEVMEHQEGNRASQVALGRRNDDEAEPESSPARTLAVVAPRHAGGGDWPWLAHTPLMNRHRFTAITIDNIFQSIPKATRLYVRGQYLQAM